MRRLWLSWALLAAARVARAEPVHRYTLEETYPADDCIAGEPCHVQPQLTIYDDATGMIATGFQGDVYATLFRSPTGAELLYSNGTAGPEGAGSTMDNAVVFYGGIATFASLELHKAGQGYRLKFVARRLRVRDQALVPACEATGASFGVVLGEPHRLSIVTHPGGATGGLPLTVQPVLAVVDPGGNPLPSVTGAYAGSVVARLADPEAAANATGRVPSTWRATSLEARGVKLRGATTVAVVAGLAVFTDLFINEVNHSHFAAAAKYSAGGSEQRRAPARALSLLCACRTFACRHVTPRP